MSSIDHIYGEVRNCACRLAAVGSNQQGREIQYDTYQLFIIEKKLLGFVGLSDLHVILFPCTLLPVRMKCFHVHIYRISMFPGKKEKNNIFAIGPFCIFEEIEQNYQFSTHFFIFTG